MEVKFGKKFNKPTDHISLFIIVISDHIAPKPRADIAARHAMNFHLSEVSDVVKHERDVDLTIVFHVVSPADVIEPVNSGSEVRSNLSERIH